MCSATWKRVAERDARLWQRADHHLQLRSVRSADETGPTIQLPMQLPTAYPDDIPTQPYSPRPGQLSLSTLRHDIDRSRMTQWYVYILRCADNTLYTGITTEPDRRLEEHNEGTAAARYTRARRPLSLVYQEIQPDRASAARREYQIKQLSRLQKLNLSSNFRAAGSSEQTA